VARLRAAEATVRVTRRRLRVTRRRSVNFTTTRT
jgi:hypothetical protein